MALEFEINTDAAKQKFDDLAEAATKLDQAIQGVNTQPIDDISTKMDAVKPVDQSVTDSLNQVTDAANQAGAAAPEIDKVAEAGEKVGQSAPAIHEAADSLDKLAQSANTAGSASQSIGGAAEAMGKLGGAAHGASEDTAAFNAAANTTVSSISSMLSGLVSGAEHATGFGTAAAAAAKGASVFVEAAGGIPGVMFAAAAAIASINWSKLAEDAVKAANAVEMLQRGVNAFSDNSKAAPEALERLRITADAAGFSMQKLEEPFRKYSSIAMSAGMSSDGVNTSFAAMTKALAAVGGSVNQLNPIIGAMDRWLATGTMTAGQLGRSMAQAGIPLNILGENFVGLARNTQLPISTINQLINAMMNMKEVELTLVGQTERVANAWEEISAAFGKGIMDSETASMKYLADTMLKFKENLELVGSGLGYFYGMLASVVNYIEAGVVTAFSAVVDWGKRVYDIFVQAGPSIMSALQPVVDVLKDVGSAFGVLWSIVKVGLSLIGEALLNGIKGLIVLFLGWMEACKQLGEALGWLVGIIAGTLYNAFVYVSEKVSEVIDWFTALVQSALPDWLQSVLGTALDYVVAGVSKLAEWFGKLVSLIAGALGLDQLAASFRQTGEGAKTGAEHVNTFNESLKGTQDQANRTIGSLQALKSAYVDSTGATVFNFQPNANGTWGKQMGGGGGGGGGGNQPGNGPFNGGTSGSYHDFADNAMGQLMSSVLRQAYKDGNADLIDRLNGVPQSWLGGQVGPQQTFDQNGQPNGTTGVPTAVSPVTLVDPQGNPVGTDTNPLGSMPFNQIEPAQGSQVNPALDAAQTALNGVRDQITQLGSVFSHIPDAFSADQKFTASQTLGQAPATPAAIAQLNDTLQQLDGTIVEGQPVQEQLDDAINGLSNTTQSASDIFMQGVQTLDGTMQQLDSTTSALDSATLNNTFWTQQQTMADEANTAATDASTAAQDAANSGSSPGNNQTTGGGGGGNLDNGGQLDAQAQSTTQFDVGGPVGSWGGRAGPSLPMSAWNNAKSFAGGGLTDGGIPIIAHPNEAVVPLQNGAIPITFLGSSSLTQQSVDPASADAVQAIQDTRQTIINVGTLAHQDMITVEGLMQQMLVGMAAIAISIASVSRASSSISTATAAITGGGGGGGGGSTNSGTGKFMRGFWGTSSNGGYLPQTSTNAYQSGGQFYDANGKLINTGGAADGLENTNMLAGMSPRGLPLVVHPNEAVVPLPDGRSIPISMPQGRGFSPGQQGAAGDNGSNGRSGTTVIQHIHVPIRDTTVWGHGPSREQILTDLRAKLQQTLGQIGQTSNVDDPTKRYGTPAPAGLIL